MQLPSAILWRGGGGAGCGSLPTNTHSSWRRVHGPGKGIQAGHPQLLRYSLIVIHSEIRKTPRTLSVLDRLERFTLATVREVMGME